MIRTIILSRVHTRVGVGHSKITGTAFLHHLSETLTHFEDLGLSQNLMRAIRHPGRAFSEHCLTVEQNRRHVFQWDNEKSFSSLSDSLRE